jgi:penicillin-binding protein 1A
VIGRSLRTVAALVLVAVITPVVCAGVALGSLIFLPLPATLPTPKAGVDSQATHVLDAAGNEIALFKQYDTSIPVQKADIPQVLKDAVIASEDKSFYSHGGIDLQGTLRALWADINNKKVVQGGSTITQQYVKLAFTGSDRTLSRKIREAILASQLDRQMDKEEILFRYLSAAFYGEGAYGIGAAAQTYFRKPVSQLTVSEAALLAGVLPAPTNYSPRDHPEAAEQRRNTVLDLMREQGKIDDATYGAAKAETVWLLAQGDPPGPATVVYPPEVAASTQPWFANYVHQYLETHLPGCVLGACPLIETGGLKVLTTLDPAMQRAAEEEAAKSLGDADLDIQNSIVSIEPPTGYVKAMVGGRDFSYKQVNTATTKHQPGSAFKPFILAEAFEQGIQPTSVWSGAPLTIGSFTMQNFGGAVYGNIDLRTATWNSVNAAYGRVIVAEGVDNAMEMANRLGAPMPTYDPSIYGASVALGSIEVSPLDMASAFGVFANHGKRAEPTPVLQVIGRDGTVLLDNTKAADAAQQVIAPVVADNVTDVLQGVIESGTARGRGIDRPAAGKTGTASDAANAWFVGFTPTLSTAVWFGHLSCGASTPDHPCPLRNIGGTRGDAQGGTLPAPVWQRYMKRVLKDVPVTEFSQPAPIQTYSDAAKREARKGFDPGARRYPTGTPATGGFVEDVQPPTVTAPTTTTVPSSTTTSTKPPTTTTSTQPPVVN